MHDLPDLNIFCLYAHMKVVRHQAQGMNRKSTGFFRHGKAF
jgi:hypothetical protein